MEEDYGILLLTSNTSGSTSIRNNTDKLKMILKAKGLKIDQEIDGSDPENKEMRVLLFKVSERGPVYPQVFKWSGCGESSDIQFVGTADDIFTWNENSTLPLEVLEEHPDIVTIERAFAGCFPLDKTR